jgi:hypothetical protein
VSPGEQESDGRVGIDPSRIVVSLVSIDNGAHDGNTSRRPETAGTDRGKPHQSGTGWWDFRPFASYSPGGWKPYAHWC